jgi:hypothetical protein
MGAVIGVLGLTVDGFGTMGMTSGGEIRAMFEAVESMSRGAMRATFDRLRLTEA